LFFDHEFLFVDQVLVKCRRHAASHGDDVAFMISCPEAHDAFFRFCRQNCFDGALAPQGGAAPENNKGLWWFAGRFGILTQSRQGQCNPLSQNVFGSLGMFTSPIRQRAC
jgi:hypothetical protein